MCIATKIIKSYFRMMTKHEIRDIIIKICEKFLRKDLTYYVVRRKIFTYTHIHT